MHHHPSSQEGAFVRPKVLGYSRALSGTQHTFVRPKVLAARRDAAGDARQRDVFGPADVLRDVPPTAGRVRAVGSPSGTPAPDRRGNQSEWCSGSRPSSAALTPKQSIMSSCR